VTKKISGSSMNQNLPMIDKDIKTVLISDPITDWETNINHSLVQEVTDTFPKK
jgi:hypothetical protein